MESTSAKLLRVDTTQPRSGSSSKGRRSALRPAGARGDSRTGENGRGTSERPLLEALRRSKVYQDYERAFNEATGLPLALHSTDSWQLPHHGRRNESRFCAMIAQKSRACAACLQVQQRLIEAAAQEPQTVTCAAGMCDAAVPVRLGERLIGLLQTGQFFAKPPTESHFGHVARMVAGWGITADPQQLREAFFNAPVLSPRQQEAVVKLLAIFAQHLSMVSNQIVVQRTNAEAPMITRAKEYIQQHQGEQLSLAQVARAINASPFYFCKMFKKSTGVNFTDYVARVRTEKAKNLLLNPNLRVSEIAFEVGFQSLTHFNRVFKRIVGLSPSTYRTQLPMAAAA